MRLILVLVSCHIASSHLAQAVVGRPWTFECGASTNKGFRESSSFNLRYISPRFKWSDYEMTEEEEKRAEKFKNSRIMLELIYGPPLKTLCIGFNMQSRVLNYKRFSFEIYGGTKFFFIPGPEYLTIPYLKAGRDIWYMNIGLLCQLNLGVLSPFADVGGDGILTVGTEFNFHKIYKKPKRRYRLNARNPQIN